MITPEAVELFRRGLELQAIGADEIDYDGDSTEHSPERLEFINIVKRLDWVLLKIHPGDAGPLDIAADGDETGGSETYRASIPRARELHALLKELQR